MVSQGTAAEIMADPKSLTGLYLTGARLVAQPKTRRKADPMRGLKVVGARGNNLQNVTAEIPQGLFTCVTGVSGGGKSTFLIDTLFKAVARKLNGAREHPAPHDRIEGLEHFDKVIDIDQSPIGRTPRSNPATYTGAFTTDPRMVRRLAGSQNARLRTGRFSFNVKGGRCEKCQGDGVIKIEMHFLPDVYVTCEECKASATTRNARRHLQRQVDRRRARHDRRGRRGVFQSRPVDPRQARNAGARRPRLYPHRPAGDNAIRRRSPAHQARERTVEARHRTHALHPRRATTGLHFHDVAKLLEVLHELVDAGNTVVVIEHNLEVIKTADWIIDLGPEGGDGGGRIVATGTPEDVAKVKESYTGQYLKDLLARRPTLAAGPVMKPKPAKRSA